MTFHPAILPFMLSAIVIVSMAAYGYFRRDIPVTREFRWLMSGQALWVIFYILELVNPEIETKIFWMKVKYLIAPVTAVLWIVLCLVLTENRQWLTRRFYTMALGWSASISAIAITNSWHQLFWAEILLEPGQLETSVIHGPLFTLYSIPSLSVVPISIIFFATHSKKARFYRNRSIVLTLAAMLPAIGWTMAQLGVSTSMSLDPVVLGLCLSSMIYAIAIFQFQVLDVLKVAQRLVIENINVGMMVVDHDKRLLGLNPHAGLIFPTAQVGDSLDKVIPEVKGTEIAGGDEWEYSITEDNDSNSAHYYLVRISEVANERVGKLGFALILLDISERKAAEKMTRESMEAKSRFFANVSHELRTPLHGISGLLELLKRTDLDQQQQEYINKATASARLLQTLIDDVLDISRIESERLEFELAPFSLQEIVEGVRSVVSVNAADKGLEFIVTIDPLENLVIGDSLRLTQVLTNLAANAVKFTPQGYVKLVARVIFIDEKKANVEFSVADSGIGIPSQQQHALFHSFSQVDSSTTRQFGGSGLGLAISQQLVKRMGSEIKLESAEGKGSVFSFTLAFELDHSVPIKTITDNRLPTNLSGMRVLVADDSHVNQQVAEELLKQVGAKVQLASNGREAVEAVRVNEFDAVLMDVQMPKMDGHAATRLLRYDFSANELPIIAMTANAFDEDRQLALEAGMTDFIIKPFQPKDLYMALQRCLFENTEREELPVFDPNGAANRFNGNEALYKKLLEDVARETEARLSGVSDTISEEKFQEIVHGIKGSAGLVGATDLAACATEIEQESKQGRGDRGKDLGRLKHSLSRLFQALEVTFE